MKRPSIRPVVITLAALVLVSAVVFAQQPTPNRGRMAGMTPYDTATEVTVSGSVEKVEQIDETKCPRCAGGTHLWLDADGIRYEVHLGPSSFLEEKEWSFKNGDSIQVTGSKVEIDGTSSILAREVTMGDKNLTLRDERGIPVWRRGPGR